MHFVLQNKFYVEDIVAYGKLNVFVICATCLSFNIKYK